MKKTSHARILSPKKNAAPAAGRNGAAGAQELARRYFADFSRALASIEASDAAGRAVAFPEAVERAV